MELNKLNVVKDGAKLLKQKRLNYRPMCQLNSVSLCAKASMDQKELITCYTQFVSMFMLQEIYKAAHQKGTRRNELAKLSFESLRSFSKCMAYQSDIVVEHMRKILEMTSEGRDDKISWENFASHISYLIPKSMPAKMRLFLRSIAPIGIPADKIEDYEFTKSEIISLCKAALEIMNVRGGENFRKPTEDSKFMFEEMSLNFAKYIYQIVQIKWINGEEQPIPVRLLEEYFRKANAYDRRLLGLLYGQLGIMKVDTYNDNEDSASNSSAGSSASSFERHKAK